MKKITLLLLAILFVANTYAQRIGFGPKVGMTLSHVTNINSSSVKPSFYVGGFVDYKFNKHFALELSALYQRQGSRFDVGTPTESQIAKLRMNYVNFPLVVKWYVVKGVHLFAGPQFGVLTDAELEVQSQYADVAKDLRRFDLSATLGAGYLFGSGMIVTVSYNFGLTKIDLNSQTTLRNSAFNIGVGWRF